VEDANIVRHYAIQKAAWIWHPELGVADPAMLLFRNRFSVQRRQTFVLHVSGDQRYELFLDDQCLSCGPDRGDFWHWSFASYRITLDPGRYTLTAQVWWIGDQAPQAQVTHRGGFILAAEGALAASLDTGAGTWQVAACPGWSYERKYQNRNYHVVGPAFEIDGRELYRHPPLFKNAAVVTSPLSSNGCGVVSPGWQLFPSQLPDQISQVRSPGKIRAVALRDELGLVQPGDLSSPDVSRWQRLLKGGAVRVPAHTTCFVLWDLDEYYCGYEQLDMELGRGARVSLEWSESLFEPGPAGRYSLPKGNRNEVLGKHFVGFGLHVTADGGRRRSYRAPWWHAGRYLLLTVRTTAQPLTIRRLGFRETR